METGRFVTWDEYMPSDGSRPWSKAAPRLLRGAKVVTTASHDGRFTFTSVTYEPPSRSRRQTDRPSDG
jgi:hypothetical protein